MGIDTIGPGIGVFDTVKTFYPQATPIHYSISNKTHMVLKAQKIIEAKRILWDAEATDITHAFLTIRKVSTPGGQITYAARRTDTTGHADVAWAIMHGLARLRGANAYHAPLLEFKTNMILKTLYGSPGVPYKEMHPFTTDYVIFMNAYFQKIKNLLGEVIYLKHLPAINMRRMKTIDQFCMLNSDGSKTEFNPGEVIHVKNYDVSQTIYGIPSYLGSIQSMLLNEDDTLFRRRYYLNGAHLGYIFYSASANLGEDEKNSIRDAVKSSKKIGNFRNLFLHLPNGREKDIQIIPVGDFSTKGELEKIKNISRDDIIAAHRIPPLPASCPLTQGPDLVTLQKPPRCMRRTR